MKSEPVTPVTPVTLTLAKVTKGIGGTIGDPGYPGGYRGPPPPTDSGAPGGHDANPGNIDADLLDVIATLEPDARRVLLAIARRLAAGHRAYGRLDIDGDTRDWHAEAVAELLDGCVYLACASMRRRSAP
jgi:hypothetical protein